MRPVLAGTVRVAEFGRLARWLPLAIAALLLPCSPLRGQVTYERLVNALEGAAELADLLGRLHRGPASRPEADQPWQREGSARGLDVPDRQTGAFETVPLVVDGVMYVTAGEGHTRMRWMHAAAASSGLTSTPSRPDGRPPGSIAGSPSWATVCSWSRPIPTWWRSKPHRPPGLADRDGAFNNGRHTATLAPLVVKDKIIVGYLGRRSRAFADSSMPTMPRPASAPGASGRCPAKGEPGGDTWLGDSWRRGGGATWMTGTYDPQLNTLYWGIGNPGPDLYGEDRAAATICTPVRWSRSIPTPAS